MLRRGASLSEIGDILGHRDPQSTMIYTKIDIKALRSLAVPWPGGVL
jgi:integrase/recombinase XerD